MTITVLLLGASIFYRTAVEPCFKIWQDMDRQIVTRQLKLEKGVRFLNAYESIKKEYKNYGSLVKGSKSDEQQMADILSEVEELARKSNVYISMLKPHSVENLKLYQKFLISVDLDVNIRDLIKFLYELQNSKKILKIENMELNAKPEHKGLLRSNLLISCVSFKD